MRARVLSHKLGYFQRTVRNEIGISSSILRAVAAEDKCDSLTVKQCLELEKPFQTLHTNQIISASVRGEDVGDPSKDWEFTISQPEEHPSIISLINFTRKNSWMQIWDNALDRGPVDTTRALAVLKPLSAPVYGDRRCILSRCHLPVENTDIM